MNIKEMHYDLKMKLNKIDSSQDRDLKIPQIDWKLNEALSIFIKAVAYPRYSQTMGLERSQRNIEDIRTLIVENKEIGTTLSMSNPNLFLAELPKDYDFYISSKVTAKKGQCTKSNLKTFVRKHGDFNEDSPFHNSSFEWEDINLYFNQKGITISTDGTFSVTKLYLDYIKKHPWMHNAEDFSSQGYQMLNKEVLMGTQDCLLPEHTHREIVDIAVLLITGDLIPDYQVKLQKLNINKFN